MAGQVTPIHHDWSAGDPGMDGLHVVVLGRKLFKLFDPLINVKCFKRYFPSLFPFFLFIHHFEVIN